MREVESCSTTVTSSTNVHRRADAGVQSRLRSSSVLTSVFSSYISQLRNMKEGRGRDAGGGGSRGCSSVMFFPLCGGGGSLEVVNRLDVFWWEEAHVSVATSPPAQRIWAVEQLDDVSAVEVQLGGMVRCEVEEGMGVIRTLQRAGGGKRREVSGEQAAHIPPFNWENSNQLDNLMTGKCKFSVWCLSAPLEAHVINTCTVAFHVSWLVMCWGYFEIKPPNGLSGRLDKLGFLWVPELLVSYLWQTTAIVNKWQKISLQWITFTQCKAWKRSGCSFRTTTDRSNKHDVHVLKLLNYSNLSLVSKPFRWQIYHRSGFLRCLKLLCLGSSP